MLYISISSPATRPLPSPSTYSRSLPLLSSFPVTHLDPFPPQPPPSSPLGIKHEAIYAPPHAPRRRRRTGARLLRTDLHVHHHLGRELDLDHPHRFPLLQRQRLDLLCKRELNKLLVRRRLQPRREVRQRDRDLVFCQRRHHESSHLYATTLRLGDELTRLDDESGRLVERWDYCLSLWLEQLC